MTALDFTYAEYTKAAAERRLYPACGWAVVLYLLGGFVAINYIGNHWMLIPAAFGAFAGTWLSIKFGK